MRKSGTQSSSGAAVAAMPRRPRNIGASSPSPVSQAGLTLAELLIAIAIGGLLLAGLSGVAGGALRAEAAARERNALETDARLAMQRMVAAVAGTRRLLLPLAENPATGYSESIRDPGVLAVTLDWSIDRDRDGFADADNDKDGRIDEDPSGDFSNDAANGIVGIDDDNDGAVDEGGVDGSGVAADDDEAGGFDEDPENGLDDDADGMVDEDAAKDRNNDGAPGLPIRSGWLCHTPFELTPARQYLNETGVWHRTAAAV